MKARENAIKEAEKQKKRREAVSKRDVFGGVIELEDEVAALGDADTEMDVDSSDDEDAGEVGAGLLVRDVSRENEALSKRAKMWFSDDMFEEAKEALQSIRGHSSSVIESSSSIQQKNDGKTKSGALTKRSVSTALSSEIVAGKNASVRVWVFISHIWSLFFVLFLLLDRISDTWLFITSFFPSDIDVCLHFWLSLRFIHKGEK